MEVKISEYAEQNFANGKLLWEDFRHSSPISRQTQVEIMLDTLAVAANLGNENAARLISQMSHFNDADLLYEIATRSLELSPDQKISRTQMNAAISACLRAAELGHPEAPKTIDQFLDRFPMASRPKATYISALAAYTNYCKESSLYYLASHLDLLVKAYKLGDINAIAEYERVYAVVLRHEIFLQKAESYLKKYLALKNFDHAEDLAFLAIAFYSGVPSSAIALEKMQELAASTDSKINYAFANFFYYSHRKQAIPEIESANREVERLSVDVDLNYLIEKIDLVKNVYDFAQKKAAGVMEVSPAPSDVEIIPQPREENSLIAKAVTLWTQADKAGFARAKAKLHDVIEVEKDPEAQVAYAKQYYQFLLGSSSPTEQALAKRKSIRLLKSAHSLGAPNARVWLEIVTQSERDLVAELLIDKRRPSQKKLQRLRQSNAYKNFAEDSLPTKAAHYLKLKDIAQSKTLSKASTLAPKKSSRHRHSHARTQTTMQTTTPLILAVTTSPLEDNLPNHSPEEGLVEIPQDGGDESRAESESKAEPENISKSVSESVDDVSKGEALRKRVKSVRESSHGESRKVLKPKKIKRKIPTLKECLRKKEKNILKQTMIVPEPDNYSQSETSKSETNENVDVDLSRLKKLLKSTQGKLTNVKLTESIVTRTLTGLGPKGRNVITWSFENPSTKNFNKITGTYIHDNNISLTIHRTSRGGKWWTDPAIKLHFLNFVSRCAIDIAEIIVEIQAK
jgi:hypothetical protein